MPENTRQPTRFGLRFDGLPAGPGPLTWAQREIWESLAFGKVQLGGGRTPAQLLRTFDLAGSPSIEQALDVVRRLVARHESLRTVFPSSPGDAPHQVVRATGEVPVLALSADQGTADAATARLCELLSYPEADASAEVPFRVGFVLFGAAVARGVIRLPRLAADGWSMHCLEAQLRHLAGGTDETDQVDPAQHREIAEFEAGERGVAITTAALRYWSRTLSTAPRLRWAQRMGLRTHAAFGRGQLTSAAAQSAAQLLAERYRVSGSAVLLAAFTAVFGQLIDADSYFVRLQSSNRWGAAQRVAVCRQKQVALLPVRLGPGGFGDLLRDTWRRSLEAYRHGRYDPTALREQTAVFTDGPFFNFNDRRYSGHRWVPHGRVTSECLRDMARQTRLEAESLPNRAPNPRIDFTIEATDHEGRLWVRAQANFLDTEAIAALLTGFEALLISAAADGQNGPAPVAADRAALDRVTPVRPADRAHGHAAP